MARAVFPFPAAYETARNESNAAAVAEFEDAYYNAIHAAFCPASVVCTAVESCIGSLHTTVWYDVSSGSASVDILLDTLAASPGLTVGDTTLVYAQLAVQNPETTDLQSLIDGSGKDKLRAVWIALGVVGGLMLLTAGAAMYAWRKHRSKIIQRTLARSLVSTW